MKVDTLLQRIGFEGTPEPPWEPTAKALRELHLAWLIAVPFEDLDIHLGREILLDEAALHDKIVGERRGGFCYELNGLFAALLRELGFKVTLLSARVFKPGGQLTPEFDHLTLLVEQEERWLVDVGFGDCFREPLRLDTADVQSDGFREFRIEPEPDDAFVLWQRKPEEDWERQYQWTLAPRQLVEFTDRCRFQQYSPDSHFVHRRMCTRATPTGRVSLVDGALIVTDGAERTQRLLSGRSAQQTMLREQFGIELDELPESFR
ncbi:MAG: arylamine N-acetyltransferase [bacterium]